jgi:hypothetical protein
MAGDPVDMRAELVNPDWVKKAANTRDTDLRAHRVALTYHFFARELDLVINDDKSVWSRINDQDNVAKSNANWFNFGTWATVTINRDLGLRRTPSGTDRLLPGPLRRSLTPILLNLRAADGQRVSRALSWGQRLVFISTTLIFLSRSQRRRNGTRHFVARAAVPSNTDEPYSTIMDLARWGGRYYLDKDRHLNVIWEAFDQYELAAKYADRIRRAGTSPGRKPNLYALRARSILLANLMLTAVEQDVVHQAVGEAINHVPEMFATALTDRTARWADRLGNVPRQLTALELPFQIQPVTRSFTDAWARFMTEQVLVLMLPSETLRLGKDVPPPSAIAPFFPPDLNDLSSLPPATPRPSRDDNKLNATLFQLVSSFDRSRGDGLGSAARDWRRYDDRMNWAVNMLRSRQQEPSLWWCPYSVEDQERIWNGKLPNRGGDPSSYEVEAPMGGLPPIRTRHVTG